MKIVLGVTSSVAIYKAADLTRWLVNEKCDVTVVMTANATRLISPRLFDALTGRKTLTDLFDRDAAFAHLETAREAAAFAVAPATANVLGKLAAGLADDALTTTALAVTCRRLAAPAMNPAMWRKEEVQRNVKTLRELGWTVVAPAAGRVACGDEGEGRLADVAAIGEEILRLASAREPWLGKHVVVTAGPTREPLDAARFLSNPSSGTMGFELARLAARRGAAVTLVTGAPAPPLGAAVKVVNVETAQEMYEATASAFGDADVLIMAAAVADYQFGRTEAKKIKKTKEEWQITLSLTVDILTELSKNKGNKLIIGFAAETDNLVENAKSKLLKKRLDMVIANIIAEEGVGFGAEAAADATLLTAGSVKPLGIITKATLAERVLDEIEAAWGKNGRS